MALSTWDQRHKTYLADNLRQWTENRVEIADGIMQLMRPGLSPVFDAEVILCCALAATAHAAWPGERIDRKRFVQLLVDHCDTVPNPTTISIGVLRKNLKDAGKDSMEEAVRHGLWQTSDPFCSRNFRAAEVDCDEASIQKAFPNLTLKELRKASYANILYEDLRCGLVHEYQQKENLIFEERFDEREVSYSYVSGFPRLIMPYGVVRDIVQSTCKNFFSAWETTDQFELELPRPSPWWIDG